MDWSFEQQLKVVKTFNQNNRLHLTSPGIYLDWLDVCEVVAQHVVGRREWRRYIQTFADEGRGPRRDRLSTLEYRICHSEYYHYNTVPKLCRTGLYQRTIRSSIGTKLLRTHIFESLVGGFLTLEDRMYVYIDALAVDKLLESYMDNLPLHRMRYHNATSELKAAKFKLEWVKEASDAWFSSLDLSALPPDVLVAISLDLKRTLPTSMKLNTENGQEALRSVLSVIAMLFPSVGYCQSLNFIAAFVLTIFDYDVGLSCAIMAQMLRPTNLTTILEGHAIFHTNIIGDDLDICPDEAIGLRVLDYCGEDLMGIQRDMNVLNELISECHPELIKHLNELGLSNFDPWFLKSVMTILVDSYFPPVSVCHLWDLLIISSILIPGGGGAMLINIHLELMNLLKDKIMNIKSIEEMDKVFKTGFSPTDCCCIIAAVCRKPPVPHAKIHAMRCRRAWGARCEHENLSLENLDTKMSEFGRRTKPSEIPEKEIKYIEL